MQSNRRNWIVVAIVVIATMIITIGTLRSSSGQQNSGQTPQTQSTPPLTRAESYKQYPTVDYDAPEDADPEKKAKRKSKNKRYDNARLVLSRLPGPDDEEIATHFDSSPIPGLSTAESEIIVVGEVLGAEAYVSNDKQGVYTELTVRVDEILKNSSANVTPGSFITADREGGFVRYGNGNKRLYRTLGIGIPRIGRRYVLFLNNPEISPNYNILTGYELKENRITPLDSYPQFRAFRGIDEMTFMNAVREAIVQPPQATPNN